LWNLQLLKQKSAPTPLLLIKGTKRIARFVYLTSNLVMLLLFSSAVICSTCVIGGWEEDAGGTRTLVAGLRGRPIPRACTTCYTGDNFTGSIEQAIHPFGGPAQYGYPDHLFKPNHDEVRTLVDSMRCPFRCSPLSETLTAMSEASINPMVSRRTERLLLRSNSSIPQAQPYAPDPSYDKWGRSIWCNSDWAEFTREYGNPFSDENNPPEVEDSSDEERLDVCPASRTSNIWDGKSMTRLVITSLVLGAVLGAVLGVVLGAVLLVVEGHQHHPNNRDYFKSSMLFLNLTTTTTTTGKGS
jgi:hypothetical protein